jgi:hypothetical protein
MDKASDVDRLSGDVTVAVLGLAMLVAAAAVVVGTFTRRERLVAWRPVDVTAPAGEVDPRGARTYRVALPPAEDGERPVRAELLFATSIAGARIDAVGVDGGARRPLLSRKPATGDRVVVPLAGTRVDQVEVVLRDGGRGAPPLRAARVATEMPISWPVALGSDAAAVAR